jgi:hypothetical protein
MKSLLVGAALVLLATPAFAAKDCEELKSEIAAKLDAKGVKEYTLEIVAKDDVKEAKVVGSCAGGAKKITYTRK